MTKGNNIIWENSRQSHEGTFMFPNGSVFQAYIRTYRKKGQTPLYTLFASIPSQPHIPALQEKWPSDQITIEAIKAQCEAYVADAAPKIKTKLAAHQADQYLTGGTLLPEEKAYVQRLIQVMLDANYQSGFRMTFSDMVRHGKKVGLSAPATIGNKYYYELAELAWVICYRIIADTDRWPLSFQKAVEFYENVQPSYNGIDSEKKLMQQYSTPGTLASVIAQFCQSKEGGVRNVLEPSAGTGLLISAFAPQVTRQCNELDPLRLRLLQAQGYAATQYDASKPLTDNEPSWYRAFDAVVTNPPFDKLNLANRQHGVKVSKLEHLMCQHALECMADDGRAALIIGGHNRWNERGQMISDQYFFRWLNRHYHVIDILDIDSEKMYRNQGTIFPVRLILIAGRKMQPFGTFIQTVDFTGITETVTTYEMLRLRAELAISNADTPLSIHQYCDMMIRSLQIE